MIYLTTKYIRIPNQLSEKVSPSLQYLMNDDISPKHKNSHFQEKKYVLDDVPQRFRLSHMKLLACCILYTFRITRVAL